MVACVLVQLHAFGAMMRCVESPSDQVAFFETLVMPFSRMETHDVVLEHVAPKFAQLRVHICIYAS